MNTGVNFYEYYNNPFQPTEEAFSKKYFKIIDAGKIDREVWYLKLLYNKKDTVYYFPQPAIYTYRSINLIPFMLTAYYTKSKNDFINKTFIAKDDLTAKEINTGNDILIQKNEKWKCTDVTIIDLKKEADGFYTPVLIFKNSKNNEIVVNFAEYVSGKSEFNGRIYFDI
jgi:hypothetical protein